MSAMEKQEIVRRLQQLQNQIRLQTESTGGYFDSTLDAALEILREPEWKPISTARRDGSRILVYCPSKNPPAREVFEAWWAIPYEAAPIERGWWCFDDSRVMLSADVHGIGATLWRPMPDAPKEGQ